MEVRLQALKLLGETNRRLALWRPVEMTAEDEEHKARVVAHLERQGLFSFDPEGRCLGCKHLATCECVGEPGAFGCEAEKGARVAAEIEADLARRIRGQEASQ